MLNIYNKNNFNKELMKYWGFLIIVLFVSCKALRNEEEPKSDLSVHFQNQGEQEKYWAKQFFEKNYEKSEYSKFNGQVKITNSEIQIGEKDYISNLYSNQKYNLIFEKGLLYPSLLMSDSLYICCIEELPFLSDNPQIKRFRFLLSVKIRNIELLNPSVYLFELTNEKATKDDNWEVFIENAKLTFLKYGWSQI